MCSFKKFNAIAVRGLTYDRFFFCKDFHPFGSKKGNDDNNNNNNNNDNNNNKATPTTVNQTKQNKNKRKKQLNNCKQ